MNAIISVIGQDRVGICAAVCNKMAEYQINILDISQTIVQGSFTMVMAVDLEKSTAPFAAVASELDRLGAAMGLTIRMQRQEIFEAMHTI